MNNVIEQVLVMQGTQLAKQGAGGYAGIYPFDFTKLDPGCFGFLPRLVIDAKKTEEQAQFSIATGRVFPQLISYFIYVDADTNKILTYRRKGKEQGLLGKYSIGIGGHIDIEDAFTCDEKGHQTLHDLDTIITAGIQREVLEETGLVINHTHQDIHAIIASDYDTTCKAHVAMLSCIVVKDIKRLVMEESEFPGIEWLSMDQLIEFNNNSVNGGDVLEPWSMMLVDAFAAIKDIIPGTSDLDAISKVVAGDIPSHEDEFEQD